MMTSNRAALSSLAQVPITEETRARLVAAGVRHEQLKSLSEMGGQSLLALRVDLEAEDEGYPRCYRKAFDPRDQFCEGCTFQPSCWQGDLKYLRAFGAGTVPAPKGVPVVVLEERLTFAQSRPQAPPPPTKKGSMNTDHSKSKLEALGYDGRQILRMNPQARDEILSKQISAQFASINPKGELKLIGKAPAMPPKPPALQSQRKAPPPPPGKKTVRKAPPPPPKRK